MKYIIALSTFFSLLAGCQPGFNSADKAKDEQKSDTITIAAADHSNTNKRALPAPDSGSNYQLSAEHQPNKLTGFFNDDKVLDTVAIVKNIHNNKYGLLIKHGGNENNFTLLGAGKDVLGQGFDDFKWIGVFSKVDRGEKVWNNVDDNGEIITEAPAGKIITLQNEGIYVHQEEECGGGIIFWSKKGYQWVVQE